MLPLLDKKYIPMKCTCCFSLPVWRPIECQKYLPWWMGPSCKTKKHWVITFSVPTFIPDNTAN